MPDTGPSLPARTRKRQNRRQPTPNRATVTFQSATSKTIEIGRLRRTGNVNAEHSERGTAQRARRSNPGSARKRSKAGRQRHQTPRQGVGHRSTDEPGAWLAKPLADSHVKDAAPEACVAGRYSRERG